MAVGYHFTVKLSTVFKSYFTAARVACVTRVKRLTQFLARHWLEAGRKLPHVVMKCDRRTVHAPASHSACRDHKKTSMLLSMSMGLHSCGLRRQRGSAIIEFPGLRYWIYIHTNRIAKFLPKNSNLFSVII